MRHQPCRSHIPVASVRHGEDWLIGPAICFVCKSECLFDRKLGLFFCPWFGGSWFFEGEGQRAGLAAMVGTVPCRL